MAITSVTPTKVKVVDTAYEQVALAALGSLASTDAYYTASTDTYGAKLPVEKQMQHYVLLVQNSGEAEATIHVHSNHHEFFIDKPLELKVGAGKTVAVVLETGKYKRLSGADKGFVIVTGAAATVKVGLIELL